MVSREKNCVRRHNVVLLTSTLLGDSDQDKDTKSTCTMSDNIQDELKGRLGLKERRELTVPTEIHVPKNTTDHEVFTRMDGATEKHNAASLLLSVADIASKEIRVGGFVWDDVEQPTLVRPKATILRMSSSKWDRSRLTPRFALDYESDHDDDMEDLELPPTNDLFAWSRARAVSMDSEGFRASPDSQHRKSSASNIVSPESSPVSRRPQVSRKQGLRQIKRKRNYSIDSSSDSSHGEKRTLSNAKYGGRVMKKILRKKFSWKNYPDVSLPPYQYIFCCHSVLCSTLLTFVLFLLILLAGSLSDCQP